LRIATSVAAPGAASVPLPIGVWSAIVAGGLVVGGLAALVGPLTLIVLPVLITGVLVALRLDLVAPALIVSSLLQATAFAVPVAGARLYPYQFVGLVGLLALAGAVATGRLRIRLGLLEVALLLYLAVNYVAIGESPEPEHAIRVAMLLTMLLGIYVVVANVVEGRARFRIALNTLLVAGAVESAYALYQLLVGALAFHADVTLPAGFVGVRPEGRIGFGYGQPYGTFQEPGWMGAVLMFFTLVFAGLYLGTPSRPRRYAVGFWLGALGVLATFSRAAWGGLLVGLFVLALMRRLPAGGRRAVWSVAGGLVLLVAVAGMAALTNEQVARMLGASLAFDETSSAISLTNTRVLHVAYSFELFLRAPILGHGPGNFGVQGYPVAFPYLLVGQYDKIPFDPSIVTTILGNTGLVGLGAFLLCVAAYVGLQRRALAVADARSRGMVAALVAGLVGLFFSYVITTGFWMGFTWVFLGLSVGAARRALDASEATGERARASGD
jgi:O-antigen ligase